jgi:hypothetical protein
MPKPVEGKSVAGFGVLASGDRVAWSLKSVNTPEKPETAENEGESVIADQQLGGTEFNAMLQSLRSRAEIDIAQ